MVDRVFAAMEREKGKKGPLALGHDSALIIPS
jgi:hypothetical protein